MSFAMADRMPLIWPRSPAASATPNLHQFPAGHEIKKCQS